MRAISFEEGKLREKFCKTRGSLGLFTGVGGEINEQVYGKVTYISSIGNQREFAIVAVKDRRTNNVSSWRTKWRRPEKTEIFC